jgi:serine/threonine-protein kinase
MPDSKAIIFESDTPSGAAILWMHSDGSGEPQRMAELKEFGRPTAVSPDGKWLAMLGRGEAGGVSILIAPIEGDPGHPTLGKITSFVTSASPNIWPQFSPDGRWVAYMSGDPGNRGIIVRAFPGPGGQWQIDSAGGFPAWSHTGHELFYVSGGRIMVTSYTANGTAFEWTKPRVWSERPVLDIGSPPYQTFDIAPDGKRAAVVLYTDGSAEEKPVTSVTFLLNFFDELRRRVPVK